MSSLCLVVCVLWIGGILGEDCDNSDPYCMDRKLRNKFSKDESPSIMNSKTLAIVLFTMMIGVVIMNIIVFNSCQKIKGKRKKSAFNLV